MPDISKNIFVAWFWFIRLRANASMHFNLGFSILRANGTMVFKLGLSDFKPIKITDSSLNLDRRKTPIWIRLFLLLINFQITLYPTFDKLDIGDDDIALGPHFEVWILKTDLDGFYLIMISYIMWCCRLNDLLVLQGSAKLPRKKRSLAYWLHVSLL